jgi:predicted transcriptional regulator
MEIIARILAATTKPCIQSKIIQQCRLSTPQWQKYRTLLIKAQLLTAQPATNTVCFFPTKTLYQTTEKGKTFLQKYNELLTILEISVKYPNNLNLSLGEKK